MLFEYSGSGKRYRTADISYVEVEELRKTVDIVKLCGCNQILLSIQPSVKVKEKLGQTTFRANKQINKLIRNNNVYTYINQNDNIKSIFKEQTMIA
jgi:hypothetical protein